MVMKMMMEMVDAGLSLHEVMAMAKSSLPIPAPDAFRRLGFCVLKWFLVAVGV